MKTQLKEKLSKNYAYVLSKMLGGLSDQEKENVLKEFDSWSGGQHPNQHFWNTEYEYYEYYDGPADDENNLCTDETELWGKHDWISDNGQLAFGGEQAIIDWFILLESQVTQVHQV